MGPFPHNAPKAKISTENPAGTDGFEFVEFAHTEPQELRELFARMGYVHAATHKTRQIELWRAGGHYLHPERRTRFHGDAVCCRTWPMRAIDGMACGRCQGCV